MWPINFMVASSEGVSKKAEHNIGVDNLIPVAAFVDRAIYMAHRLTALTLYHRVSKATGFLTRRKRGLTWEYGRYRATKHFKFKGFLHTK
jgi:hypothetical protein